VPLTIALNLIRILVLSTLSRLLVDIVCPHKDWSSYQDLCVLVLNPATPTVNSCR
jgi:hypothetical protein